MPVSKVITSNEGTDIPAGLDFSSAIATFIAAPAAGFAVVVTGFIIGATGASATANMTDGTRSLPILLSNDATHSAMLTGFKFRLPPRRPSRSRAARPGHSSRAPSSGTWRPHERHHRRTRQHPDQDRAAHRGRAVSRAEHHPRASTVIRSITRPASSGNERPTQKATRLFEIPTAQHTRAGDVVLEPFSGSGSQLIVAEKLGRRWRAMEISPAFVDTGIRRWQKATGKHARLESGGAYAEVAIERSGATGAA